MPKYSGLDQILELIIDKNYDLQSIKKYGFNEKLITKIWNKVKVTNHVEEVIEFIEKN